MPEFYRGGSRSAFSAQVWAGALTANTTGASTTILTVPPGSQNRLKRIAVTVMLPKTTSAIAGWFAFYREDADTSTSVSGLAVSNPQVLRPKVFVNNPDHAVYLELYLEAITLDGGAKLHLMGQVESSGSLQAVAGAKWYSEQSLHY